MGKGIVKKVSKTWDASRFTKEAVRAKKSLDNVVTISNKARTLFNSGISMNDVQQRLLKNPKDRVYIQARELLHCADIQKQKCNMLYPRDIVLPEVPRDLINHLKELQILSNTDDFPKPIASIELSQKQIGNLLHVLKTPDTCVHVWSSLHYHYYQYHSVTHGVIAVAQSIEDLQKILTLKHFFYQIKNQSNNN